MRADEARTSDSWFRDLRDRFVAIAARRVERDAVEDVVQDALRIVHEKGGVGPGALVDGRPALAWCFQVLRNVIGNHYQKRRARTEVPVDEQPLIAGGLAPLESLVREERHRLVHRALARLAERTERCADYLQQVVAGQSPAAIAARENVDAAVLYRRLYRCREQLRAILEEQGVQP